MGIEDNSSERGMGSRKRIVVPWRREDLDGVKCMVSEVLTLDWNRDGLRHVKEEDDGLEESFPAVIR